LTPTDTPAVSFSSQGSAKNGEKNVPRPERGATRPYVPSGIAIEMSVPMRACPRAGTFFSSELESEQTSSATGPNDYTRGRGSESAPVKIVSSCECRTTSRDPRLVRVSLNEESCDGSGRREGRRHFDLGTFRGGFSGRCRCRRWRRTFHAIAVEEKRRERHVFFQTLNQLASQRVRAIPRGAKNCMGSSQSGMIQDEGIMI
jgi:hypothetical protein